MSRKKKLLLAALLLLGLSVLGLGGALALLDLDALLTEQTSRYLPQLEQQLGRPVKLERVATGVLGGISGKLQGLTVGAAPGSPEGTPPLARIEEIRLSVAFWPALLSLGRDLRIREVAVTGLTLHVARDADGRLSHDDVLQRLAGEQPPEQAPPPPEPLSEEARAYLRGLKVERIALEDAAIHVVDRATGGAPFTGSVEGLTVELLDLRGGAPLRLQLRARVFAGQENLRLAAQTSPLPEDLLVAPESLAVAELSIWAAGLDLARLTPYLGEALPVKLVHSTVDVDLRASGLSLDPGARAVLEGRLKVTGLQLQGGVPFDLQVSPNLTVAGRGDHLSISSLTIELAGMQLQASGEVHGLKGALPSFSKLKVELPVLDLGRLQQLLPPLAAALPPGTRLAGPLSFSMSGDGDTQAQQVVLKLQLTPATVVVPGAIWKEAGVPLALEARLRYAAMQLAIEALQLQVGPLELQGQGGVNLLGKQADLKIASSSFPIDGLVKLLPAVATATPPGVSYSGTGSFSATVHGQGESIQARLSTRLAGARVELPGGARVVGEAALEAQVGGNPENLSARVSIDLDRADLQLPGTLAKPAGTPAHLLAEVAKQGSRVEIGRAELAFGPLLAQLSGSAALGAGDSDLRLEVARTELAPLARMVPGMAPLAGRGGSLAMKLHVAGDAARPATLHGELQPLELALGRSRLRATAKLERLQPLKASFDLRSPMLDLDELLLLAGGAGSGEQAEQGGGGGAPRLPADLELQGKLAVDRGVANKAAFSDLRGELVVARGVITLRTLEMKIFDGKVAASGSRLDLSGAEPTFEAVAKLQRVSAQQLLASQTGLGNLLSGRLSMELQTSGRGLDFSTFSQNLAGSLEGSLSEGRLNTANILGGAVEPLLRFLPAKARQPKGLRMGTREGTPFRELAGQFAFRGGKLDLAKAMRMMTSEGLVELTGAIGLDRALALKGTYHLSPKTIAAMTGGKFTPAQAIPVALLIGGTLLAPKVEGVDLATTGRALAEGYLKGAASEQVEELKAEAERQAREAADQARRQAEEQARRAADEARQRVAAEKKKAEEQVRKAADEAKRKAKEEAAKAKKKAEEQAKKALKGLL